MINFKKILPAVKNDIANSLAHVDKKKAILSSIPYFLIFFISNKISYLSRVNGKGIFDAILNFQDAFTSLLLSFNSKDLLNGILATGVFFMIIYLIENCILAFAAWRFQLVRFVSNHKVRSIYTLRVINSWN